MFAGFESVDLDVDGATIHARTGGEGPPLLLLHGYPQTHAMWHRLAPALARGFRVVVADLRGYGASRCHDGDGTFRAMARDQVALMRHLGHETFHLVAHDRGARTAHRLALDHPHLLRSLALLDILPTLDAWRTMDDALARKYFHWLFLSQHGDMARRLISADPLAWLHHALGGLGSGLEVFAPPALAAYEAAARDPEVVAGWCRDYTAAAGPDLDHDRADRGRTLPLPTLVLWGARGVVASTLDPLETWRAHFPAATGHALDAGHFLVEERPDEVLAALEPHLAAAR